MPPQRQLVLGQGVHPTEDELRLPRPPGLIRRFWSRHTLLADILIAFVAFLLTAPAAIVSSAPDETLTGWAIAAALALPSLACVGLIWRRKWPVTVFAVALAPALIFDPVLASPLGGIASIVALYSIAVYRSVGACWIAFGAACAAILVSFGVRSVLDPIQLGDHLTTSVGGIVFLLIGALLGVNVGNRRRYLDALIDRSRQLLVERDQQSQLAVAAERTRIAREMHDIVSHSLTVVVALADGAAATTDPARASEATRAIAETARAALREMRVMLGVLRDDDTSPLVPTADASVQDVVAGARATGATVSLRVTGAAEDTSPVVRLATLRVVTEGLTNAIRYARKPAVIRVDLHYDDGAVEVSVENEGATSGATSQGAGLGLKGVQERVTHVGGAMDAGLVASDVWRLHARIPRQKERHG